MQEHLRVAGIALLLACGAAPASGTPQQVQITQIPPGTRDPVRVVRTGTGVIKGRVVDGVSGAPVARARVRLQGTMTSRPLATTDANGAFVFTTLPSGQFMVSLEKSTYQPGRYPDAGRTMRGGARSLILRDGETRDDLVVRIYHGSAISGRVVDAYGDPVDYAEIRVMRVPMAGGTPQMRGGGSTNDIGEFRIGRLDPGTYLLLAVPHRNMGPDEPSLDAPQPAQPIATYFPNTPALDQAQPIVVQRGQSVTGVEIAIAEGIPAVVTGTVVGRDGQPVAGNGYISARGMLRDNQPGFDGGGSGIRQDGTFRLQLAPGDYLLEARVMQPPQPVTPQSRPDEMFGTLRLSVAEGVTEGVSIVIGRGATAAGRIIFEGTSPLPPNPGQTRIPLFSSDNATCRPGQAQIAPDWTFRVEGLAGTCTAAPPGGVERWMLKAVLHNGEDLSYRTITFEPGQQMRNLQIILTDKRSELAFHVTDDGGHPTREYVALVFPVDKSRWTPTPRFFRSYIPPSDEVINLRSTQMGRPAQAPGTPAPAPALLREALGGLIPGEYYVIALDDIESELTREPPILERLSNAATRVTIAEGATEQVTLRRVSAEEVLRER